jgi:hypothetical protein
MSSTEFAGEELAPREQVKTLYKVVMSSSDDLCKKVLGLETPVGSPSPHGEHYDSCTLKRRYRVLWICHRADEQNAFKTVSHPQ